MTFIRRTLNQAERAETEGEPRTRASGVEIESSDEWRENSRALEIVLAGPAEIRFSKLVTAGSSTLLSCTWSHRNL